MCKQSRDTKEEPDDSAPRAARHSRDERSARATRTPDCDTSKCENNPFARKNNDTEQTDTTQLVGPNHAPLKEADPRKRAAREQKRDDVDVDRRRVARIDADEQRRFEIETGREASLSHQVHTRVCRVGRCQTDRSLRTKHKPKSLTTTGCALAFICDGIRDQVYLPLSMMRRCARVIKSSQPRALSNTVWLSSAVS